MVCLAYIPAMSAGYIWDDDHYVTENVQLETPAGLKKIWLEPRSTPQFYPMVFSSFWIEFQLWQLNPVGYHIDNIALHAINALLLLTVLTSLRVRGAFFAAAIFAVHPVHVESVAWITERKNVLSGMFYLLAFLAYWRFASSGDSREAAPPNRRWWFYVASIVLYGFALLSKSVTCSLPAVILLVLWWKRDRLTFRKIAPLLPMFLVGIVAGLNTVNLETHHVGAQGLDWDWSLWERCLIAGRAAWFYAGKLFWPRPLIFIYPKWSIDSTQWWQSLFPLSAMLLVVAFWFSRKRIGRGPLVGVLCFGGTLLPALGFLDVYPMRYSFVADHFQYLASIGLITLFAAAATAMGSRVRIPPRWAMLGATALLCALGFTSFLQCFDYQDEETLWVATLDKNPDCWMANFNLAAVRFEQRRFDEATIRFLQALKHQPGNEPSDGEQADLHHYLGDSFQALGNAATAKEHFRQAGDYYRRLLTGDSPHNTEPFNNLGILAGKLGEHDEAIRYFKSALEIDPNDLKVNQNLGELYFRLQKFDNSGPHFQKVIEIDPQNTQAHYNLGVLYLTVGKRQLALEHLREALRIDPEFQQARLVLRQVLGR